MLLCQWTIYIAVLCFLHAILRSHIVVTNRRCWRYWAFYIIRLTQHLLLLFVCLELINDDDDRKKNTQTKIHKTNTHTYWTNITEVTNYWPMNLFFFFVQFERHFFFKCRRLFQNIHQITLENMSKYETIFFSLYDDYLHRRFSHVSSIDCLFLTKLLRLNNNLVWMHLFLHMKMKPAADKGKIFLPIAKKLIVLNDVLFIAFWHWAGTECR